MLHRESRVQPRPLSLRAARNSICGPFSFESRCRTEGAQMTWARAGRQEDLPRPTGVAE